MPNSLERPVIALISNPQTGKTPDLPKTALMQDPVFAGNVAFFDHALGLNPTQSLEYQRQIASVIMSDAAHNAFLEGLRTRFPYEADGQVVRDPFRLFLTGHSIGEMTSFMEGGIIDPGIMIRMLVEREGITNRPVESGVRFMLAAVNIDMTNFKLPLSEVRRELGNQVDIVLANINNRMEGVFSLQIPIGMEIRAVQRALNDIFAPLRHPESEKPVRFIYLESLTNAFHSRILRYEQHLLNTAVAPYLTPETFGPPDPSVIVYSAIAKRRIRTANQAIDIFRHQLLWGVDFPNAMAAMMHYGPLLVVTADPTGVTPRNLVEKNIGTDVPIANIKDLDSLGKAVDLGEELIRSWRETHSRRP